MNKLLSSLVLMFSQHCLGGSFEQDIVSAAIERTKHDITYDGSYFSIAYPNGDVPKNIGVCTDVIIRTYRSLGIDLQMLVHQDMSKNFAVYPSKQIWGLNKPDRNIDHRRVPNLQVFLARYGESLPTTLAAEDYAPGDIVTWSLPRNLPHIGIVSDTISDVSGNPLVIHNIGSGPTIEDMLFRYQITGHYRYIPQQYTTSPLQ